MHIREALSFDDVLLVPSGNSIPSRSAVDTSAFVGDLSLRIPILAANMPSVCEEEMASEIAEHGGLGVIHRMCSIEDQVDMVVAAGPDTYYVGAAIGIGEDWLERSHALVESGAALLCIDVAHGHQDRVLAVLCQAMEDFPTTQFIVGNIATADAAEFFLGETTSDDHDRLALKVGVGGGSVCTTRIKTGFGVPTLQSVLDVAEVVSETSATLIADGGIKTSGDIVKCLAAGADAVMLGSLLAGTTETPGRVLKDDSGRLVKVYRGSASYGAKKKMFGDVEYVEGAERLVPYKGSVTKVLKDLMDGVRSGMTYCGAGVLGELQDAEFIRISSAGYAESLPHGVM